MYFLALSQAPLAVSKNKAGMACLGKQPAILFIKLTNFMFNSIGSAIQLLLLLHFGATVLSMICCNMEMTEMATVAMK